MKTLSCYHFSSSDFDVKRQNPRVMLASVIDIGQDIPRFNDYNKHIAHVCRNVFDGAPQNNHAINSDTMRSLIQNLIIATFHNLLLTCTLNHDGFKSSLHNNVVFCRWNWVWEQYRGCNDCPDVGK